MSAIISFHRLFFTLLSLFFFSFYFSSFPIAASIGSNIAIGLGVGFCFSLVLFGIETLFSRFRLRHFTTMILGLFIGFLAGKALETIFTTLLDLSSLPLALHPQTIELTKISLYLFSLYLGVLLASRSVEELHLVIPFVKGVAKEDKKRDLIVDPSALSDPRMIDLASCGILDELLIIPRFVVKELQQLAESPIEAAKQKARKSLEVISKLQEIETLKVRFDEKDFLDIPDIAAKVIRLARLTERGIITSDMNRVQMSSLEGIRIVNIHSLSNALKPLMQNGEMIKIKIQRYGKEPRQGVGYLEDGTMVVVNGGGDYIGETIDTQVLSVKHTNSGRMVFCNACDEFSSEECNQLLHEQT